MPDALSNAFHRSVNEGAERLHRSTPSLLATGAVGGIDVSIGVFGLLLVKSISGNDLAAALAFSIGFIALTLANSELFTENFLVPITTVTARKATARDVVRLWAGTATMNLLGGLVMVAIMMTAFPELNEPAVELGQHFIDAGVGTDPFLGAVIAGIIITLMTWMQLNSSPGTSVVAAVAAAFLLAYGELGHVVVASLEMFAGMFAGADYTAADWFPLMVQMTVGNAVGGIGLVTMLRLVQIGPERMRAERVRDLDRDEERRRRSSILIPHVAVPEAATEPAPVPAGTRTDADPETGEPSAAATGSD